MPPSLLSLRSNKTVIAAAAALLFACGDDSEKAPTTDDAGSNTGKIDDRADAGSNNLDASANSLDASQGTLDAETPPDANTQVLPETFSLQFAYTAGDRVLGCGDTLTGQGLDGKNTVDINDLRFFVSDLRFLDKDGKELAVTLDSNDYQIHHPAGLVSLVDLTSNDVGGCTADVFPNSEGTKRVHTAITGTTQVGKVTSVRFTIGVPQPVMKKAIQENTAEGQPSPLADLQWPWALGWRHFALNFGLKNAAGEPGIGFIHLGSRDCAAAFTDLALSDRDSCTYVNNPQIVIDDFSLATDVVTLDIPTLVKSLDFVDDQYDAMGNVTGQGAGVGCHSLPTLPDCTPVFAAFGLSLDTGKADASKVSVFGKAKR